MKIRPVAKNVPSPIPTAAEAAANPALIEPARAGRTRRGLGALVGAGLLGSLLASGTVGADEVDVDALFASLSPSSTVPDPADAEIDALAEEALAEAARKATATVVAPILQKALDDEGRGSFGCLAVDPPMFLSESDALDFIVQQFANAGVKLFPGREIDGFTRRVPDRSPEYIGKVWRFPVKTVQGSWTFDLATEDGSIVVEYLSSRDEEQESFNADFGSSLQFWDIAELAQRLREDFATRTNGPPVTIGVFFDPLSDSTVWDRQKKKRVFRPGSVFTYLSPAEKRTLMKGEDMETEKWRRDLMHLDALDLLREQIEYFLDWARKEGKIPLNGDPT